MSRVRAPEKLSVVDLEQACAALAAADAHRDDAPLGLAPAAFLQDVAGETRTGHTEGVTDRDRAAVDIVLLGIDAELVAGIEALAGEGFVELPEIDVLDLQAIALQQLRHGVDRSDAHLIRLAARRRPANEAAERIETALLGVLGFHQHDRRRAVGELAGVAGGDVFAGALDRLELGEAFHGGLGTVALVAIDGVVDDAFGFRRLVDHLHPGLHRDDFVLELVGLLGGRHAALRFQRVFVLVFAAELVALGDDVGGVDHRHEDRRSDVEQLRIYHFLRQGAAGDRDAFDAAGHDAFGALGADTVGGHSDGLQSRRTEPVHGYAAGRLRQSGEQSGLTADIGRAMRAVSEIAILDVFLVDASALDGVLDGV